jgi:hypothetical protein
MVELKYVSGLLILVPQKARCCIHHREFPMPGLLKADLYLKFCFSKWNPNVKGEEHAV